MIEYNNNSYIQLNRSISIVTKLIDKPEDKKLHTDYRFIFVISGNAKILLNEKEYNIKANDLLYITPYSITEIISLDEELNFLVLSYNKMYISKIINSILSIDKLFIDFENSTLISVKGKEGYKIKKILLEIRKEIGDDNELEVVDKFPKNIYSELFIVSKFLEFLVVISRNFKENKDEVRYSESQMLIRYIYAHSNEKLTINKLATIFFMSESTVRKYISEFSDLTFNELLYKIRLSKTEDLLLYTNLSLDEIANVSGFVDGSHITKIWNMNKNLTPSLYRNMYKESLSIIDEEDKKKIFDIINYMNNMYMEDLKIEEISNKFSISEIKINKLLLAYVDRNFNTYLNSIRINAACKFLLETELSIIDICFKVGYNNVKTFNNNFSKNKNMTPTKFRELKLKLK